MNSIINQLFITALYTIFVQNLIFCSGFGMSEALRVSTRPGTFLRFAITISGFSVFTSLICKIISTFSSLESYPFSIKSLLYGTVLLLSYLIVISILKFVFKTDNEFLGTIGIAALNTLVLAVPFINSSAAYSLLGCIGSGLGAGIAFVIASSLIYAGTNILNNNDNIPEIFKGTPSLFLFVGIISLGFSGFYSGQIF